MANIKPQDLPTNVPEKVAKSYEKANKTTGTAILEKGKEVLEKGKEKVKEVLSSTKEGDLPASLPEKVKDSYRKANLDMSSSTTSLVDKGKQTLEKGKETLERGKEKVKEMFRPELDIPSNVPEKVRQSHLEYSTRLFDEQPSLLDKGKETLERGKEKIIELFQRDEPSDLPEDVPERVQESYKEYKETVADSDTLLHKIEGTIENTYEKGKEKIISLFSSASNEPEFCSSTPQIVRDSYCQYETRLREEQPSLLAKGKDMIKGMFATRPHKRPHLDLPMYVPERVRQSHLEYEESLTAGGQSILSRGKEMVKEMLGI
jgi:exonuclease VII small subunit